MTRKTDCKPAQRRIAEGNAEILRRFPFDDTRDLDDARRGFIGTAAWAGDP